MKPDEDLSRPPVSVSGIVVRDDGRIFAISAPTTASGISGRRSGTPFEGVVRLCCLVSGEPSPIRRSDLGRLAFAV